MERGPASGQVKDPGGVLIPSRCVSTQKMAANVKVVVRVRPLNQKEVDHYSRIIVDVVDDKMLVFDPKEEIRPFFYQGVQQPNKNYMKRANKELKFVFDNVCGMEAANKDVFETTTKDMVASLMEGYNCSVFVYGATGAGKTFTMIGNKEHPGITYLTMEHLFDTIYEFEKDRDFDIGVSYIEVYNENVYDLLKPSKTALQLREDTKCGVMVVGLTLNKIKTARELLVMLKNGNKNRTQHPTNANAESSRSHAVFQVYITMSYKTSNQVRLVKLSMIDLPGSERASATGCIGERFKEGANINRSLLSLANCINKLADGSSYIPYRDSKLTRLLKDSLGGNCKTVMIANVSPSSYSYEDTYNTLKYAARATKIQLSIKKNIVDGDMRASQYVRINEELKKKKVKELEAKLTLSCAQKVDKKTESKLTKMNEEPKKKVKELEAKLTLSGVRSEKEEAAREKAKQEWRHRILVEEERHSQVEAALLALMSRARVLALRHRLRTRAFTHVADLAHCSSNDTMEQMCTEEISRQERAAQNYTQQALRMDAKILSASTKWEESKRTLSHMCNQALSACPELKDFVDKIQIHGELRYLQARNSLQHKLLILQNEEINAFSEYVFEMPNLLKKLYLTLKGYEKVTPGLTAEYTEIMKKMKSAKGISWSDDDCVSDMHFKFISNFDLEKPMIQEYGLLSDKDVNATIDIVTDSEDLTDQENREPIRLSAKKRKGTPIKLMNNETIIINDSLESLDTTKNSAKKVKVDFDPSYDTENLVGIQPLNLKATFDMAGKIEALKKQIKTEPKAPPVKRELTDRTNTMQTSGNAINFENRGGARIVKPVAAGAVGAAIAAGERPAAGFGSSLARDGKPLNGNNVQGGARIVKPVRGRAMSVRRPGAAGAVGAAIAAGERPAAGFGSSLARDGKPLNGNNVQAAGIKDREYHGQWIASISESNGLD